MTLLLTAANGRTGRAILKALANRGADVKVFLRDEAQWPALEALGAASFAVGDMEDAATIDAAMASCDGIIHIGPPMHPNEVEITRRFIAAARLHGLSRFVYYSVMHPLRRAVRHHRLKLDAEEALIESGLPYTIVQPIRYMQHLALIWKKVLETGVHATCPSMWMCKFNVADLRDLAEATAIVATEPGHLYITYELAGPEALSQRDMAAVISRVLGREIRAEALSLEQVEKNARAAGAGDDRVTQMLTMNQALRSVRLSRQSQHFALAPRPRTQHLRKLRKTPRPQLKLRGLPSNISVAHVLMLISHQDPPNYELHFGRALLGSIQNDQSCGSDSDKEPCSNSDAFTPALPGRGHRPVRRRPRLRAGRYPA